MQWTKERKIYAALLAAGLVALGVDHVTRSAPEPAEDPAALAVAKPRTAAPAAAKSAGSAVIHPSTPTPTAAQTASFSKRLRLAATTKPSDNISADVFRPSTTWIPKPVPAPPPTTAPAAPKPDETVVFRAAHRLTAVLLGSRKAPSRVIVDGNPLRVGQTLDHFRLTEIEKNRATFQSRRTGAQITLSLEEDAPARKALAHTDR